MARCRPASVTPICGARGGLSALRGEGGDMSPGDTANSRAVLASPSRTKGSTSIRCHPEKGIPPVPFLLQRASEGCWKTEPSHSSPCTCSGRALAHGDGARSSSGTSPCWEVTGQEHQRSLLPELLRAQRPARPGSEQGHGLRICCLVPFPGHWQSWC